MNDKTYFILSREIFNAAIWMDNPHILKLFVYLVGNARYKKEPKKYPTFEVKRGEFLTSLNDLAEANEYMERGRVKKWSRAKVGRMLKVLEEQGYIKLLADTYGTHISICNYELYQDPSRYKADSSDTGANTSDTGVNSDCNGSENNSNKGKKGKKVNTKTFCLTSNEVRLSKLLLSLIRERNENHKEPNIQTWAKSIDLMHRVDKRTWEDIEKVIKWCQADTFWQNNILSTAKLREKYDQLKLKMSEKPTGKRPPVDLDKKNYTEGGF